MSKSSAAESLLALFAGRARAAAIYGDLLELAATRNPLWFWTAYARTLLAFTGRSVPGAFVLAFVCVRFMFRKIIPWIVAHRSPHLNDPGLFLWSMHHRIVAWNLSLVLAQAIIFAAPFVVVRYGLHDRLTRLTLGLFAASVAAYSFRAWVMNLSDILILLLVVAALLLAPWRKPLLIVVATVAAPIATKTYLLFSFGMRGTRHVFFLSPMQLFVADAVSFAVAAIACSTLHRRLMEHHPHPTGEAHA